MFGDRSSVWRTREEEHYPSPCPFIATQDSPTPSPTMANVAGQSFLASSSLDQTSQAELLLQSKALEELLSVLLSAGYFRARVASLSAFDKVVGGLCWCITSSGIAVDVDIFYDEELALGQKMCV